MSVPTDADARQELEREAPGYANPECFDLRQWLTPDYSGEEPDSTESIHTPPRQDFAEVQHCDGLTQEQLRLHNILDYQSVLTYQATSSPKASRRDVTETGRQFEPVLNVTLPDERLSTPSPPRTASSANVEPHGMLPQGDAVKQHRSRRPKRSREHLDVTQFPDSQLIGHQIYTHPVSPRVTISEYKASGTTLQSERMKSAEDTSNMILDRNLLSPIQLYDPDDLQGPARQGLSPSHRSQENVLSVKELEERRQREDKNAEVEEWLEKSDSESEAVSEQVTHNIPALSEKFMGEEADLRQILNEYEEQPKEEMCDSESTPSTDVAPEEQEPLNRQFIRRTPWQDPPQFPEVVNKRSHPLTSYDAMHLFERQAGNFETASRSATWGTRRRLSDSEIRSIVEGNGVRHLSLSSKGRLRGGSIITRAKELLPRRKSSKGNVLKQQSSAASPAETLDHKVQVQKGALSPTTPLRRISSFGRSKPHQLSTGSALVAMAGPLAAVGRGAAMTPGSSQNDTPPSLAGRSRSKSDLPRSPSTANPGLVSLMTNIGGPPVPGLAPFSTETAVPVIASDNAEDDTDDDEEDESEMNIEIEMTHIQPTLTGFRDNILAFPRCHSTLEYLVERIALEQLRRYKKLSENKVRHVKSVSENRCLNHQHCQMLGGSPEILEPRKSARDPEGLGSQFEVIQPGEEGCINDTDVTESQLTPATFPQGIPIPPVPRLPAKFECPLCFKVREYRKPSDWSKHVHEDLQPFSCTFTCCQDPKSFKRKADWVRHENERHRHLERWECNVDECGHVCYRKDNFVQHLVREHRMKEPRSRNRSPVSSSGRQPLGNGQDGSQVMRLVEVCRHETTTKPTDEPCKFCGERFPTWKKLSAHMGKHMECLAIPVLELVRIREVSPDTVISPIVEQNTKQGMSRLNGPATGIAHRAVASPYTVGIGPSYPISSNGHSPAITHIQPPQSSDYSQPMYYSPAPSHQVGYNEMMYNSYHPNQDVRQAGHVYANLLGQSPSMHGLQPVAATYPPANMVPKRSDQNGQIATHHVPVQGGLHINTGPGAWTGPASQPQLHQQSYYQTSPEQTNYGLALPDHGVPATHSSPETYNSRMMATSHPMQHVTDFGQGGARNLSHYYNG